MTFTKEYSLLEYRWWQWKDWWQARPDEVNMWLAWHLPRSLVKWAAVRLMAHATTGAYSSTVVGELTALEALKRWDNEPE